MTGIRLQSEAFLNGLTCAFAQTPVRHERVKSEVLCAWRLVTPGYYFIDSKKDTVGARGIVFW